MMKLLSIPRVIQLLAPVAVGLVLLRLLLPGDAGPTTAVPVVEEAPAARLLRFEDRLPRDSTLEDVLLEYGLTPGQIHQLIVETRDVYNLNRVKAGHRVAIARRGDGTLAGLEYVIDDVTELVVDYDGSRFYPSRRYRALTTRVQALAGVIEDSFYNAVLQQGESGQLAMNALELLRWDVDFTAIQPDDSFELLYETRLDDGHFVRYGEMLAARFSSDGRTNTAFRFEDPATGKVKYYDADGKSVRKAFLKVPFNYDYRISSGFSHSRFHPVLKARRPHLGVDFAAPYGTPVLASGAGRVIFAGRKGGNGNLVQIRHTNGYTTHYLHLSRIYVRRGQRVSQGQRIGAVGATGLVTGVHLDYRIQDPRGRYLNPRRQMAWPSDTALPRSQMKEFIAVRDALLEQLERLAESSEASDSSTMAGD